jgi:hypothetical protein
MLNDGTLQDGDELLHMDADMRIDKFDEDYPCDKSFSVAIDNGNSFCMGSYKLKVNSWTRSLVDNILDESLWERENMIPTGFLLESKRVLHFVWYSSTQLGFILNFTRLWLASK